MQLAEALDRLPNGFPRTPLGVELAILRKIFSPEEVSLASQLSGKMETVDVIAKRVGFSVGDAEAKLTAMTKRGVL